MQVKMINDIGVGKEVKAGYSWTFLLFGILVPLFRLDWKWFGIVLGANIILGLFTMGIGAGIFNLAFSFFYNKIYIKELIAKGFKGMTEKEEKIIQQYIA